MLWYTCMCQPTPTPLHTSQHTSLHMYSSSFVVVVVYMYEHDVSEDITCAHMSLIFSQTDQDPRKRETGPPDPIRIYIGIRV